MKLSKKPRFTDSQWRAFNKVKVKKKPVTVKKKGNYPGADGFMPFVI